MSPPRNWESPNPSLASDCAIPPEPGGGGGHTRRLRVRGWGSPNSDEQRKSLALCLLCVSGLVHAHNPLQSLQIFQTYCSKQTIFLKFQTNLWVRVGTSIQKNKSSLPIFYKKNQGTR